MTSQDGMNTVGEHSSTPDLQVSLQKPQAIACPSVKDILSETTVFPPCLPTERTEYLSAEEQTNLLTSLQETLKNLESENEADIEAFMDVRSTLDKIWSSNSDILVQAANLLANGSRNCEYS